MIRLLSALGATLAIVVIVHVCAAYNSQGLYTPGCYLGLDVLYLFLAVQLFLLSFCLIRKQAAWSRAASGRGILVAGSLLFFLGTTDLYIILFRCDTSGLGGIHCFTHYNWGKRFARSNQFGYWERDLSLYLQPRRPDQQLVIAAVGDSWTWGQGVPGKQYRFTNVLEADLQPKSPEPVAVLNFGRAGADTREELTILEDVAKVQPDIVLLCYLANDIDRYAQLSPVVMKVSAWDHWLTHLSPSYNFLYWRVYAPRSYHLQGPVNEFGEGYFQAVCRAYQDPTTMGMHLKDIEALIVRVRAMNATPVLVILPFPSMWQDGPASEGTSAGANRALRDRVYAAIAQKVRALNAAVIEAQKIEDEMSIQEFALNPMDAHPSKAAHRRIAQVVGAELARQKLVKSAARP